MGRTRCVTLVLVLVFQLAVATPVSTRANPYPVHDRDERRFSRRNLTRLRRGYVECPCSMTNRGYEKNSVLPNVTETILHFNVDGVDNNASVGRKANSIYADCAAEHGHEACVNWDAASLFVGDIALCMSDRETNRNVIVDDDEVRTVGPCDETDATRSPSSSLRGGKEGRGMDGILAPLEGCVDVAHLRGKVKSYQHVWHLKRNVLCYRAFCATPNHAIIVDNVWTSMSRLCSSVWSCTADVRLVNNLNMFERTRLVVQLEPAQSDNGGNTVIITPYDVRLPRFVTWLLQIAEFACVLAVFHVILGASYRCSARAITMLNKRRS